MPLSTKTLQYLVKKTFQVFQNSYYHKYQQKLPIILVTGTTGKSSMTLILNQYFENLNYKVYSGTSLNRNLNSLAGLGMILTNTTFNLEDDKLLHKASAGFRLIFNLLSKTIRQNFDLQKKTILIYELGYDHQSESQIFQDFFGEIDVLVCTNLGWEHNDGFGDEFDLTRIELLKKYLPKSLIANFDNSEIAPKLKNIALEQLTLASSSKVVITPSIIGSINNNLAIKNNSNSESDAELQTIATRSLNFDLETEKYKFNPNYFLPDTFAKNANILEQVAQSLQVFDSAKIGETLYNVKLPLGRFGKFRGVNNTTVIDSTYNSDPNSAEVFIGNVQQIIEFYQNLENRERNNLLDQPKHYLILGEMRELGDSATTHHQHILEVLSGLTNRYSDYIEDVLLIGTEWLKCDQDSVPKIELGISFVRNHGQVWKVFSRAGDINQYLQDKIRPNSWIWVKGSQNTIFSEIVVENLLADKADTQYLCRRGPVWDKVREGYK